jgi:hypothetical protein
MKIGAVRCLRIRNSVRPEDPLLQAPLYQRQRIDHQIIARGPSRDAYSVPHIPVAEDQPSQDHNAVSDGHLDMPVEEVSIRVKRSLNPFFELLISRKTALSRGDGNAAVSERT